MDFEGPDVFIGTESIFANLHMISVIMHDVLLRHPAVRLAPVGNVHSNVPVWGTNFNTFGVPFFNIFGVSKINILDYAPKTICP